MKDNENARALDICEKFDFFYGQRAGRELWFNKPVEVQNKDVKQFAEDIAFVKDFIKRQNEEIESLEAEIDKQYEQAKADILGNMSDGGTSCHWCIEQHRVNAITEFVERVENELAPTMIALFVIGEILVDVSKSHLSSEEAVKKIRDKLNGNNVIGSRVGLDRLLDKLVKELAEGHHENTIQE